MDPSSPGNATMRAMGRHARAGLLALAALVVALELSACLSSRGTVAAEPRPTQPGGGFLRAHPGPPRRATPTPTPVQEQVQFERVEDFRSYPIVGTPEESGPGQLLDPASPLSQMAKIRGVNWPLVANEGSSRVYEVEEGIASFYNIPQKTATGEKYDPESFSAAHKTLPFGTMVRCTRLDTGASVIVVINDRGPYVRGRIIDLSVAAARSLGMVSRGIVRCRVEVLAYPLVETMGPRGNG